MQYIGQEHCMVVINELITEKPFVVSSSKVSKTHEGLSLLYIFVYNQ